MDVIPVHAATSSAAIKKLGIIFATHGLPERIVTDNGAAWQSDEFKSFLKTNGVTHTHTDPYHPASNVLGREQFKRSSKESSGSHAGGSLGTRLARFLFKYRITPHTTTGHSPAELLLGRQLRSQLHLLHQDTCVKVRVSQARQSHGHDKHTRARAFQAGDCVYVWNFVGVPTWLEGTILDLYHSMFDWQMVVFVNIMWTMWEFGTQRRMLCRMNLLWLRDQVSHLLMGPRNSQRRQFTQMVQLCRVRRDMILSRRSGMIRRPPDRLCWTKYVVSWDICMWLHFCDYIIRFVHFRTLWIFSVLYTLSIE